MMHEQKKFRFVRWIYERLPFLFCLAFLGILVLLYGRVKDEQQQLAEEKMATAKKEQPPANVVIQEILPTLIRERISLPGILEPWTELDISAEVAGAVQQVFVTEGDSVQAGDVIATIDSRDYENRLKAVKASHELAVLTKNRLERLLAQNSISQAELDGATARVAGLSAEMDIASLLLQRSTIKAPIAGVVNVLHAEQGRYYSVGDPVAKILAIDKVKVVVGIPESDVDAVRKINSFDLTVDAISKDKIEGKKHFLSVAPDSMAQLYRLELAVDNTAGELLPGMFARVDVVKQVVKDAVVIPLYSVISRKERRFVYTVEDEKAAAHDVELGILEGWQIQITKGLSAGDRVIVVGHRNIDAGQPVNIVRRVSNATEIIR
jgi:membrane fusion protein (multidrug efflux system)